ncbi:MAG: 4Fe-4S binding protein [Rhodothermaceae bacterium]
MKVHLIYFSPGGSTKKTVKNIAKGLLAKNDLEVVEIDMLKKENREKKYEFGKDDLVILGMMTATKLYGVPNEVIGALNGNNTPFVGVVTCGNGYYGKSLITMKKGMEKQGFNFVAGGGFIGQYSFTNEIATNRPDEKDAKIQYDFGYEIYRKVIENNNMNFDAKLKIDWPDEGTFSTVKCALISAIPGLGFKLPKSWNELGVSDECTKCQKCVRNCPVEALSLQDKITQDRDKCIGCQACVINCPQKAIKPVSPKLIKSVADVVKYRDKRKEPEVFI